MTANSFGSRAPLEGGGGTHEIYRLDAVPGSESLPYSLKVLLENLLRNEDGKNITKEHITALANWDKDAQPDTEIQFPAPRTPSTRTGRLSSTATASASSSCAGARTRSTTSASSRPAPASCTR